MPDKTSLSKDMVHQVLFRNMVSMKDDFKMQAGTMLTMDILKQLAVSQCIKTRDIKEAKMPKLIRKVQQNFLKYLSGDHGIFLSNHLYLKEKHESARKIH